MEPEIQNHGHMQKDHMKMQNLLSPPKGDQKEKQEKIQAATGKLSNRAKATHWGTQPSSTISIQSKVGGQLKSGAQTDKATGLKGLQSRVYTWTALGGSTPNNQQFSKSYSQKTDNSSTQTASNPKILNIKTGIQAQKRTEPIMKPEQATCKKQA